ncbi:hypothetical protein F4808DRAFT_434732 [Astrocystis sublimbata]|nr:hypothetical protein F4808DRAFT_434732 [Astrocystis sublimbata]
MPREAFGINESGISLDKTNVHWPRVMISVKLHNHDNIEFTVKKWLSEIPPSAAEFRGLFPCYGSHLLLLEVSVAIWDLLPPCPAVTFMGFITGPSQHDIHVNTTRSSSS